MLPLRHALAVAVVQIFILSENWALAKNINFYNVRPPLDPTPFPNSFKCFTCENAGDNYNCNRWAEDKWCPQNTQYCLTVHHFTSHGRSTSITKKCASRSECHFVGCHHSRDSEHTVPGPVGFWRASADERHWLEEGKNQCVSSCSFLPWTVSPLLVCFRQGSGLTVFP
ncbi:ly6/PLAUR domain-containing protein 6B isoform X2 [Callorhinus ursinus]|uniref:ly6/PLAUR domain-containing protein 6B isoform X2 n=1 Tax=Callorhinus ursinus TaxID=34884 RepID=UPI003CD045EF